MALHPYLHFRIALARHGVAHIAASLRGSLEILMVAAGPLALGILATAALPPVLAATLPLALDLSLPVRVLLLDEPFNGLDAAASALLSEELLARVHRGADCIILTSHTDPGLAQLRRLDLETC